MKLTIDQHEIDVTPGTTLLEAARTLGIDIPTMCYLDGHHNHPSCYICVVEDVRSGRLVPSCAMPAEEGMVILSGSPAVLKSRKDALELLLSEHVGDCQAPCQLTCPAGMDIPLMNRLIAAGRTKVALEVVRREIALPLVLGYICPAPCEKGCKRKYIDSPVQICLLKRFTAMDKSLREEIRVTNQRTGKRVAVIGSGPAGLAAAFHSLLLGHETIVFDKSDQPGGALRYAIPDDLLPKEMLDADIDVIRLLGGRFEMNSTVGREEFETIRREFDAVILATGFTEDHPADAFGLAPVDRNSLVDRKSMATSLPGVFGCGSLISEQLLSVRSVDQGKRAAWAAHRYMTGEIVIPEGYTFRSVISGFLPEEKEEYLKEATRDTAVDLPAGYLDGFNKEEARREAARCLHCDCRKQDDCKLRIHSEAYEADRKKYPAAVRKPVTRNVQHDLVVYEPGKCIRCGLCISIAAQKRESLGLTFIGRGFDVRVAVPFSESLDKALAETSVECSEACPTGAIARKLRIEN